MIWSEQSILDGTHYVKGGRTTVAKMWMKIVKQEMLETEAREVKWEPNHVAWAYLRNLDLTS